MKQGSIVIFSSGISEKKGITEHIKRRLTEMGYFCMDWRGVFASAHAADKIALLPLLIKKIPTFDFAVLICEGHDTTYISRGADSKMVKTMRDNVLFEIGLCTMALGLNRTILVADDDVRIPDDLQGKNGQLAVKRIALTENEDALCREIDAYIRQESGRLSQIIIGAAASSACGYASNFICRVLEHIDEEVIIRDSENTQKLHISPDMVHLHVVLPNNLDPGVLETIRQRQKQLLHGTIPTARSRPAEFNCYFEGDELHIVDHPTNVVTSYDTARMILEIDADDTPDELAAERFVVKEMALYAATLQSILGDAFVRQVIDENYKGAAEAEKERFRRNVVEIINNRLTIEKLI